jgi:hypothetical protein
MEWTCNLLAYMAWPNSGVARKKALSSLTVALAFCRCEETDVSPLRGRPQASPERLVSSSVVLTHKYVIITGEAQHAGGMKLELELQWLHR